VYDPETGALVIRARGGKPAYERELAGRIIVHFDERGEPVEIELLDATELLAKLRATVESAKRAARPPTPAEKRLELALKLARGEKLSEREEAWLDEPARETRWGREEVAEELASAGADPSSKVERYREIFERCYREALELAGRDTRQAGEKAWGAAVALVKLHAAAKRVPTAHWDHGRLYNYVAGNVESEHRELFRNLLRAAHVLHEHFYEGHLDAETFSQHFNDAVKLIEEAAKALGLLGAAAKPHASG